MGGDNPQGRAKINILISCFVARGQVRNVLIRTCVSNVTTFQMALNRLQAALVGPWMPQDANIVENRAAWKQPRLNIVYSCNYEARVTFPPE